MLGPYWEPGRKHVETLYDNIPFPSGGEWDNPHTFERRKFDLTDSAAYSPLPDAQGPPKTTHHPVLLSRKWTLDEVFRYLGTFSALSMYNQKHGDGDSLKKRFLDELQQKLKLRSGESVEVNWPMAVLLFRKKHEP
jgi:hypothetical protein